MDQVWLAWLGLWLEAAHRFGRGGGVDSLGRRFDAGQYRRQRGRARAHPGTAAGVAFLVGRSSLQRAERAWSGEQRDCILVTTQYGRYPHTDQGVEVRRIFHKLRSLAIENFNEHFKGIFDGHGQVLTKGLVNTRRFALGAIFVYQLALLYRFQQGLQLNVGLKAFLKAA